MQAGGHDPGARGKLQLDLGDHAVQQAVGTEQIDYYRKRAPWFDSVYNTTGEYDHGPEKNAQWRARMDQIVSAISEAGLHGDCVELGCGSGYWSQHLAQHVDRLWALDAATEMITEARNRLEPAGVNAEFEIVDLWDWQPTQQWDCAAAFFFIEHVPDEIIDGLLQRLHGALKPGAPFVIAEGAWSKHEPNTEVRSVDGQKFRVIERRRSPDEFEQVFDRAGFSVEFGNTDWFIDLVATRR